jgi:hypothetical protein
VSRQEECLAPETSGHGLDCRSTEIGGTDTQSSASFIAPVIEAQFALLELTSQCALAWINTPIMVMAAVSGAALSGTRDDARQESVLANVQGARHRVTAGFETSGFVPMITGIEDTLHDEFFEPRPGRMTEREMAALWKRSNEFEPPRSSVASSDTHQEAA